MSTFTIEPNVGPLPLRFGMSSEEVANIVGNPVAVNRDFFGNREERRPYLNLSYSADGLQLFGAVFMPGLSVNFEKHDLFKEHDPINFLRQFDQPYSAVGFIFYLELGIRLSGFLPNDEEPMAISVVRKGEWDEFLDSFKTYK